MNDLFSALSWLIAVEALGVAALPLTLRWFRWLPDRGYAFAKPLGILLVSYAVWLAASFAVVDNSTGAAVLAACALFIVCWRFAGADARQLLKDRWRLVLGTELLFVLCYATWVFVRAHDPAIAATEKPMEIAFLSSAMRSPHIPPVDPWLSGYGISYYYFGYVAMAILAKLSGVPATVAFNLAIALLFALTISGAFALSYSICTGLSSKAKRTGRVVSGLLAGGLVAIAGNLEVIVEILNARSLLSPGVWQWLAIKDLPQPYISPTGLPNDYMWWWRASRVVGDFDLATGVSRDYTINEVPFFSFLLGDLHPHVLALPFALLAMAVALNLLFDERRWTAGTLRRCHLEWLLIGLVFGGLGFLNSWDMPAYMLLLVLAFAARQYQLTQRITRQMLGDVLTFGALVGVASIVLYLPFYLSFHSQASGLGVVAVRTKLQHFGLFWAPLALIMIGWLIVTFCESRHALMPKGSTMRHAMSKLRIRSSGSTTLLASALAVFIAALVVIHAEVAALLLVLLAFACLALHRRLRQSPTAPGAVFVTLALITATALIFLCEWLFIRDLFNNRMNTVFKLYYQSWIMLAVCAGPVIYYLAARWQRQTRAATKILGALGLLIILGAVGGGFIYPVTAIWAKTDGFSAQPTLDGMAFLARSQPDDAAAITWLQVNVEGTPVVLEATGGSYGPAGRVSAFTGLPTLLGWDFHEQQWRGSYDEQRCRKADIDTIYSSMDRATAQRLLRQYDVTYVYVGPLERNTYGKFGPAALDKFSMFMDPVFRDDGVTIFQTRG